MRLARNVSLLATLGLLACHQSETQTRRGDQVVPVRVAKVVERPMPLELRAIGTVEAYSSVAVRSQVSGVLEKVAFTEGQEVKAGDLLFQIDERPFRLALAQAQHSLARDQSKLDNTRSQVKRYEGLVAKEYVTQQQYDNLSAEATGLEATAAGEQASVEAARLNLAYSQIKAPISGRTGRILVRPGNLVKALDSQPLVVIAQTKPVRVSFAIPEYYLGDVRARFADKLEVQATPRRQSQSREAAAPLIGTLTFMDNEVDQSTGTILLKADFANDEETLWPGAFVDVRLLLGADDRAIVVPASAVEDSQTGTFVFVVKTDKTVEPRPVEVARSDEQFAVIAKGLTAGETVVTDGQLRLVPGAHVAVHKDDTPQAAAIAEQPTDPAPKADSSPDASSPAASPKVQQ